jgi:hypothetical protein
MSLLPIQFASINISGLLGKQQIVDFILQQWDLEILFISETWTGAGIAAFLHPDIIHSQEFDKQALGRNHYGQCLVIYSRKQLLQDLVGRLLWLFAFWDYLFMMLLAALLFWLSTNGQSQERGIYSTLKILRFGNSFTNIPLASICFDFLL